MIYCYCNLDLIVTIAKIVQNILGTAKNESNIFLKMEILEKRLMLHYVLGRHLSKQFTNVRF